MKYLRLSLVILLILVCSACNSYTGGGNETYKAYEGDTVVAQVNGENIYYSEVKLWSTEAQMEFQAMWELADENKGQTFDPKEYENNLAFQSDEQWRELIIHRTVFNQFMDEHNIYPISYEDRRAYYDEHYFNATDYSNDVKREHFKVIRKQLLTDTDLSEKEYLDFYTKIEIRFTRYPTYGSEVLYEYMDANPDVDTAEAYNLIVAQLDEQFADAYKDCEIIRYKMPKK